MKINRFHTYGIAIAICMLCPVPANSSDQVPAPPQKQPIALVGGIIHTVSGDVIEGGTVVFNKGKLVDVGTTVVIPSNALRVDIAGKHVYPGLIETVSQLGLAEIDAVRATLDYYELGSINPNVRAEKAVNPDSERIPVTRSNGIALAVSMPRGGLLSGQSALMMLDGWTWEDMTLKAPVGMVIDWPQIPVTKAYGKQQSKDSQREQIQKRLDELEKTFREARAYKTAREAAGNKGVPFQKTDVRWESLIPVLDGKLPVWILANSIQEIETAVEWADRQKIRMVLVGGADAPQASELLKRKGIPIVVTPILRLPSRRDSDYDEQYTVPLRLYEAGIPFCIAGGSSMGNERNLPYHAAMAAAFGLPKDITLKSVTLFAARILGVDDRVGSIEKGKDATLIVTDGDPLEITTHVEMMYIQGRNVDLNNRQKMLYAKYREKYRQLGGK